MANITKSGKKSTERRKAIKKIGAAGGIAATSTVLPKNWTKPIVQSVVLPAHAQASCADLWSLSLSLQGVDDNSRSEDLFNLDFVVQTPNGGLLQPPAGSQTSTLQYTQDLGEASFDAGPTLRDITTDRVRERSGPDAQCAYPQGTYRIFIRATSASGPGDQEYPIINVRIRARGAGGENENQALAVTHFTSSGPNGWGGPGNAPPDGYQLEVAQITFPAGTVTGPTFR